MELTIRIPDQRVDALFKIVESSACGCDPVYPHKLKGDEEEIKRIDGILRELHTNVCVAMKRKKWAEREAKSRKEREESKK